MPCRRHFPEVLSIILLVLVTYSCTKRREVNSDIPTTILVLTESDDPNNPLYIAKIPSFENYNTREYITNKTFDTLSLTISNWDLLTIGAVKNNLDTLIVNVGDTLSIKLSNGELLKSLGKKKIKKWNYNSIFKSSKTKQKADSLFNLFFEKRILPMQLEPLKVTNGKYQLLLTISENQFNSKISQEVKNQIPFLLEMKKQLIIEYQQKLENEEVDQNKIQFYTSFLKREIEGELSFLHSRLRDSTIREFLLKEVIPLKNKNNSAEEYADLNNQINLHYFNYNSNTSFFNANELYKIYNDIPNRFDSIWIEKARMICIERMAQSKGNIASIVKYFDDFNTRYKNPQFKKYIEDEYLIDNLKLYKAPYDINFIDQKGVQKSWTELKASLAGKVIYADYWASWCGPCRRAIPASRKLKKLLKNQEIVFVYFSIDEDKNKWLKAIKEEKIKEYEHNYLILNHNASNLENKLKIKSIPRYLIYDKKGQLVNHNAPGPEKNQIRLLLNALIDENKD